MTWYPLFFKLKSTVYPYSSVILVMSSTTCFQGLPLLYRITAEPVVGFFATLLAVRWLYSSDTEELNISFLTESQFILLHGPLNFWSVLMIIIMAKPVELIMGQPNGQGRTISGCFSPVVTLCDIHRSSSLIFIE